MRTPKDLRGYQWRGVKFVLREKGAGLFLDMGLGKTIITLSAIKALITRKELRKPVLLVAPVRVIKAVWRQEAALWSHTRDLRFSLIHGSQQKRRKALDAKAHVYLINPENLTWLIDLLRERKALDNWPFDMLVIDESSMFKSASSKRFTKLRHVVHLFKRRYILTGTPTPNTLLEIWPQMFILDQGDRLGSTATGFKSRFFAPSDYAEFKYAPRPGAARYIYRLVKDVIMRMDASDYIDVPPTLYNTVRVPLEDDVMRVYRRLERDMFYELEHGVVIDAVHAGALAMKCHQFANGAVYYEDEDTGAKLWREVHRAKLDALHEIVEETSTPVMVAYQFQHDLARLQKQYPRAPVLGTKAARVLDKRGNPIRLSVEKLVEQWNARMHRVLLVHPKSGGHGLNMQFGGNTMIFFSLTYSLEQFDQLCARIGGTRAQAVVTIHSLCATDTVDEAIMLALAGKAAGQNHFLHALRQYRIEAEQRLRRAA